MTDHVTLSLPETLEVAEGLLSGWNAGQPSEEFSPRRNIDESRFMCVYGLAAHAHRLARAAVTLYRAELALEALPTIRCTYEHALKAMWVAQYPDGARALVNEFIRNRKNVVTSVTQAGWAGVAELATRPEEWDSATSPLDGVVKSMEKLCKSLTPGGADAYSIYRLMCTMAHPGAHLVDYYIHKDPVGVQLSPKEFDSPETWMYMTCCSLVWAGRSVDMIHKERGRRNELRGIAKKLGVPLELHPTYR